MDSSDIISSSLAAQKGVAVLEVFEEGGLVGSFIGRGFNFQMKPSTSITLSNTGYADFKHVSIYHFRLPADHHYIIQSMGYFCHPSLSLAQRAIIFPSQTIALPHHISP